MPPTVNYKFHVRSAVFPDIAPMEIGHIGEQGKSPENPIYVPVGAVIVGAKVIIQNADEWFYDYDDRARGGSHRYNEELYVQLTTNRIIEERGANYGYALYQYDGRSPPNHLDIDIKSPGDAYDPGNSFYTSVKGADGLQIIIYTWRVQVFANGGWDEAMFELYHSETLYVTEAPTIFIESTQSDATIFINGEFAGYTPMSFIPHQRFSGTKTFTITATSKDPTMHCNDVTMWMHWDDTSPRQSHNYINLQFVPKTCSNPTGSQNETRCDDYDSVKCDAGEWIVVEKDSPNCGYPKPIAQFKASWVEGSPAPVVVAFTDESTYTPSEWHWDFGDGTTSTEQNPTHAYSIKKGYDVKLRATNQSGSDTVVKHITLTLDCTDPAGAHGEFNCIDYDSVQCNDGKWVVIENDATECGYPKPTAIFRAAWTVGSPPRKVTFTDISENNPTSWHWDFGDGFISGDQHTTHIYTEPGVHTPRLTVSNKSGSDTSKATIDILYPCTNPDGGHGALDCIGFDRVKCGDGTWGVIEANSAECGYPSPMASFVCEKVPGDPPRTYQFTDTSENFPASWSWDFGDGSTSTDQDPSHTYTNDGTYEVTLTVTNPVGDDVTISEIVVTTSLIELPEFLEDAIDYITSLPRDVQIGAAAAGIGLALVLFPRRRKPRREPRNH